MYESDGFFGMDQIHPMMGHNHELFDYSENFNNNNQNIEEEEENQDNKFLTNNDTKKEKFIAESSIPIQSHPYSHIYKTREMMKSLYDRINSNIMYLFVIFILIVICIIQKQSMDQMKLFIMLSMQHMQNNIKPPMI